MRTTFVAILLAFSALTLPRAEVALDKDGKLLFQGSFTLRGEADWDSQNSAGVERNDRNRARLRTRLGMTYDLSTNFRFGVRVRTGNEDSQQSQFFTILDSDNSASSQADFIWDKYYVTAKKGGAWGTAGRDDIPFWTQNEVAWDADVTIPGISGGYHFKPGKNRIDLTAGYFSLPDGAIHFAGNLAAGQVVYMFDDEWWSMTTALGFFFFNGSPGTTHVLDGNGARDYSIWIGSAQLKLPTGHRPITFGVDFMHNDRSYSETDPDPFTVEHRRERDGYVLSAIYGWLKQPYDWQVGFYHARVETLALNSSYTQDDWARWGTSTQGDLTDLNGYEYRGTMILSKYVKAMARYYLTHAITSPQDGKRFRLDFTFEL